MITLDSCSIQDVDRLLGLAAQFLDGWAEDAVQGGKPDEDYEQRSTEWKVIRPFLVSAPAMQRVEGDRAISMKKRRAKPSTSSAMRSGLGAGQRSRSDSQTVPSCSSSQSREFSFGFVF
jgi:hypothetical protein